MDYAHFRRREIISPQNTAANTWISRTGRYYHSRGDPHRSTAAASGGVTNVSRERRRSSSLDQAYAQFYKQYNKISRQSHIKHTSHDRNTKFANSLWGDINNNQQVEGKVLHSSESPAVHVRRINIGENMSCVIVCSCSATNPAEQNYVGLCIRICKQSLFSLFTKLRLAGSFNSFFFKAALQGRKINLNQERVVIH